MGFQNRKKSGKVLPGVKTVVPGLGVLGVYPGGDNKINQKNGTNNKKTKGT